MAGSSGNRYLVLGRVGNKSLHNEWLGDGSVSRSWDLQLSVYGDNDSLFQNGDLPAVVDNGTKNDSVARFFAARPEFFEVYDNILILEDDILLSPADINRLFEIGAEYDLDIAQPSLTYDSYISYPILLHCGGLLLRYSNFLEGQAYLFKSSYLKTLMPLYARFQTGWGIDYVAALSMPQPQYRAAIIDAVQMNHTRPLYSGALYKQLAAKNISPLDDLETIKSGYVNLPGAQYVYGGVGLNGEKVGAAEVMRRNAAFLFLNAHKCRLRRNAYRMSAGLLLRSFSKAGYRPEQVVPKAGSELEELLAIR